MINTLAAIVFVLLVFCQMSVLLAEESPMLTASGAYDGPIYTFKGFVNNWSLSRKSADVMTVTIHFQNKGKGTAILYKYQYEKNEKGEKEMVKVKLCEVKGNESVVITIPIPLDGGIWLKGGSSEGFMNAHNYSIELHEI